MNVLIFTGKFGMGHVFAAQAVREEILRRDPDACVTVVDVIEECFPQMRRLVYGCFDFTVNYCSGIYNLLNRMAGRFRCTPVKRTMVQKLEQLLARTQADLVISTLPLSSQYVSAYKKHTGSRIPLYTYITDISAHSEWIAPYTNCYFVGDESTRRQLMCLGVPGEQIVVNGIPVRQDFRARKEDKSGRKELLVMGGGLGLIPHAEEFLSALAASPEVHVTVITGKNETLRRELEKTYPTFEIVGFTSRVAEYMARADLLLTKAGGITTFEAIHSGTPLCLLRPFLLQEEANASYVQAQGFGKVLWNKSRETQDILDLLADQETLDDMKQRMAVALRSLDQVSPVDRFWAEQAAC